MPEKEPDRAVYAYPLARLGINMYSNPTELQPEEAVYTQNCIWRNGMVKRGGSTKVATTAVVASKKGIGLHKFYYSGTAQLMAAAGTILKYLSGSSWVNAKTGLTDGANTFMTTWLDKLFVANGTDTPFTWSGSSATDITATNAPASPTQFLPYQDRMLAIQGGDLVWSPSFDETGTWGTVANIGVRPDSVLYGMIHHGQTNTDSGYEAKVLLAGANGMYLFFGTDLRWPSTTGNYVIYPLATSVGCNAPRTMAWTPKGTIWLGIDRQVYLLPFNASTPIPIGHKIWSYTYLADIDGIEDTPPGQIANACATYHNGFYKLSVAKSAGTYNTVEWWLDISRLFQDENGYWGPWYGPMLGNNINAYANLNGPGDSGELYAIDSNASIGAFVYKLDQKSIHSDVGTAIHIYYQTFFNTLGNKYFPKEVHQCEATLRDTDGSVGINFSDIENRLKTGDTLALSGSATYWDENYWDEIYWTSSQPIRQVVNISPALRPRSLSLTIENNTATDTFELYGLSVYATELSDVYGMQSTGTTSVIEPTGITLDDI